MTEADSQHQSLCHLMHVHTHACEPTHVQKNAYTHIHHKHTTHKMRKKERPVPKAQFDATVPQRMVAGDLSEPSSEELQRVCLPQAKISCSSACSFPHQATLGICPFAQASHGDR